MTLNIRLWHIIIIIILVGLFLRLYPRINDGKYHSRIDKLSTALYESERAISTYKIRVDSLELSVSEQELIIVSNKKHIKDLVNTNEALREVGLKRVRLIGELRLKIAAMEDSLENTGGTVIVIDSCGDEAGNFIKLPLSYSWENQWASAYSRVDSLGFGTVGFELDSVPINIMLGTRKEGIFSRGTEVSSAFSYNPYVEIDKTSFIIQDKQKPRTDLFLYGAGVGIIGTVILSFLF